jgi:hypothetical protein
MRYEFHRRAPILSVNRGSFVSAYGAVLPPIPATYIRDDAEPARFGQRAGQELARLSGDGLVEDGSAQMCVLAPVRVVVVDAESLHAASVAQADGAAMLPSTQAT